MKLRVVSYGKLGYYNEVQRLSKIFGWVKVFYGTEEQCRKKIEDLKNPKPKLEKKVVYEEEI